MPEETDILNAAGIPLHIRWYANKCASKGISMSTYAGWDIFTRPVKITEKFRTPNRKLFSTTDIYLDGESEASFEVFNTIASESRIYLNGGLSSEMCPRLITAPYISIHTWVGTPEVTLRAGTFVVVNPTQNLLLSGISEPADVYLLDDSGECAPPFTRICNRKLASGCYFTNAPGGFNEWHLMALGLLPEAEVIKILNRTTSINYMAMESTACLRLVPSQQVYIYPEDLPKLSTIDYSYVLCNRTPAEICTVLEKPFLSYYPNVKVPNDKYFVNDLIDITTRGIMERHEE